MTPEFRFQPIPFRSGIEDLFRNSTEYECASLGLKRPSFEQAGYPTTRRRPSLAVLVQCPRPKSVTHHSASILFSDQPRVEPATYRRVTP